jgi:2-isopropylmalate synthase
MTLSRYRPLFSLFQRSFSSSSSTSFAKKERLIIFDTTLRDGEQSPGCTLQIPEKIRIAHQLSRLGVDVCEAGFPVASPGDFEAVSTIAKEVGTLTYEHAREGKPMTICGLARATKKDIDRCFEAIMHAPRHRIHTFLATSDIHLKHKLKMTRSEALAKAVEAVSHAKLLAKDIEFSTEDGGRSDPAYLAEVVGAVIEAGATTINVPDTVGYTLPNEYAALFSYLIKNTRGAEKVVWSTHCHNDLGLAAANTLAAVQAGARQVEVTVNGIGERAGNTALEEVVMTISTRPLLFPVKHFIDTTQIVRSSRLVSQLTGMMVQPNKAIIGANAFAHESGIHQDGMLKEASTYEIMTPQSIGLSRSSLILGKHSGRHAFAQRLKDLGFTNIDARQLTSLVDKFKALADEKKVITDADMEAIVYNDMAAGQETLEWSLLQAHIFTGTEAKPTATISMRNSDGSERSASAMGTGPIDAVYNAIKSVVGRANDLVDFKVNSVTDGQTALGEVTIKVASASGSGSGKRDIAGLRRISMHSTKGLKTDEKVGSANSPVSEDRYLDLNDSTGRSTFSGTAINQDIVVAAAQAYVAALNRLLAADKSGNAVKGAGDIGASV